MNLYFIRWFKCIVKKGTIILDYLQYNNVEAVAIKYSFKGGYSLKPLRDGKYILESIQIYKNDLKELNKLLNTDIGLLKITDIKESLKNYRKC